MHLAPSHVEVGEATYSVGYVNLVNKNGILVKPVADLIIELSSGNPAIASVPSEVIIQQDSLFGTFDVKVGNNRGETAIYANFNDQTVFQNLIVGENNIGVPYNVKLIIHLPSKEMHVESKMPFSVFLQTSDGTIIQAPHDIEVTLDYEDTLIELDSNNMTIKKGAYYAWGIIKTNDKVGTAFIKTSQNDLKLQTAQNIRISSSLPSGLEVNVFPKIIAKEVGRNIDVIVNLVDSEGLPTLAQEDIHLEFFSDNDYVGQKIDETMQESIRNGIIKKGEFSYHFRQKLTLNNVESEITIGASTEGLGIAYDCFMTRQPYTSDNPIAQNKTMHVFTLDKIPSNSNTVAIYQIGALIESSGTEKDEKNDCVDLALFDKDKIDSDVNVEFHPILSNENLVSEGSFQKVNLISSDGLLLNIIQSGNVNSGYSYGTAKISSGKETGEATLSTTIKGIGSASSSIEIVNTLKHVKTNIFSPTGSDKIQFDNVGNFDLFIIALDGRDRPTFVENEVKYLLTPVNELVEISKGRTFTNAKFHSDSFGTTDKNKVLIEAIPIGISADDDLKSVASFEKDPSSMIKIILPYNEMDANTEQTYTGIVQLIDFNNNPIQTSRNLQVKINATNSELINIPRFVNIDEGNSFGIFSIDTSGEIGQSMISANVNGVVGSQQEFKTKSFLTKLKISTGSVNEPVTPGEPIELKLYVDDQYLESVEGASLKIVSDSNNTVTPTNIKTGKDGSAKVYFTAQPDVTTISLQIFATAEGYVDEQRTFEFSVVSNNPSNIQLLELGFPDWIVYIGIVAILVIVIVIFIFLKKPKQLPEDEYEVYEDEDI
ncbi:MAG: hypothetical protein IIA83_02785 [Thaumarchaeota archaeon]|nr:hypothetical protein [Nitrososphaerota archaeon]